ncbi:MAG: Uncharacterized protein XD63_1130 [Thermoanaerobacterales bacterium 50_218]|nr:MAG: Uncharacterized protein XD63_1130 [Thermoanaerobacterales bacterium 50_218]HAA90141.1 hypothetical protein [Peptococcaceae bacterium]
MNRSSGEGLTRKFWEQLLNLYDEFMVTGKRDEKMIEMLERANLLQEGTRMGREILDSFPHLDFKTVDQLVRQGIRETIVNNLKAAPE